MGGGVQVDLRLRKGATISIFMPDCCAHEEPTLTDLTLFYRHLTLFYRHLTLFYRHLTLFYRCFNAVLTLF